MGAALCTSAEPSPLASRAVCSRDVADGATWVLLCCVGWSDRSGWLPVRLIARPCLTWRWHLLTGRPGLRGNWLRVLGFPGLVMVHWCAEPASVMGGCRTLVLSSSVDLLVDRAVFIWRDLSGSCLVLVDRPSL